MKININFLQVFLWSLGLLSLPYDITPSHAGRMIFRLITGLCRKRSMKVTFKQGSNLNTPQLLRIIIQNNTSTSYNSSCFMELYSIMITQSNTVGMFSLRMFWLWLPTKIMYMFTTIWDAYTLCIVNNK